MRVLASQRIPFLAVLFVHGCDRDAEPSTANDPVETPALRDAATAPREPESTAEIAAIDDAPASAPPVRKDGTIYGEAELMGTRVSINVYLDAGHTAAQAGVAMQAALEEMARIEDIMSEWRATSELSRLNALAGRDPQPTSDELFHVLERSKAISAATEGAFDVTFHGVGQLWSFRPGAVPPSREAVKRHLPLVDWRKIDLDVEHGTARLRTPGMKIGLGAIAKGYAVDRAAAVLTAHGFSHHVVEAGGDTYASGTKGGKPWTIGVQDPGGKGPVGILRVSDQAVVTSGGYQRFFEHEGKRYAHIIDPRTGFPLEERHSPTSVTLVAGNTTDADAYCTAVTVMGVKRGMAFVEQHPALEAVILDRDGKVLVSSGLAEIYVSAEDARAASP